MQEDVIVDDFSGFLIRNLILNVCRCWIFFIQLHSYFDVNCKSLLYKYKRGRYNVDFLRL